MDMSGYNSFAAVWTSLITMNLILLWRKKFILRRWWTRPGLKDQERRFYGAYRALLLKYKKNDHEKFYEFVGLSVKQFNFLHSKVASKLTRDVFCIRKRLESQLKLAAVLNFLVHSGNVSKQAWFFRVGRATLYKILPEVCQAITEALDEYISLPEGHEWHQKAQEFNDLYGFPNTVGIVDGKHIPIRSPPHSGAFFHNFKSAYSIVLMAVCDAFGKIIWASVGDYGSMNDAGNFNHCELGLALETDTIRLPKNFLPNTTVKCPYFFIADGGFSLKKYLMKPFRKVRYLATEKKIFNIRLQRARKTIERVFGIMCKRWQILDTKLNFKLETTELIVMSVVCLYNYTFDDSVYSDVHDETRMEFNTSDYRMSHVDLSSDVMDFEETTDYRMSHESLADNSESDRNQEGEYEDPTSLRQLLCEYFISSFGSVHWQWKEL